MKKIIAFAMSALLAVSAVALPVTAEPAVPFLNEIINQEWVRQARPISAQELAQVRSKAAPAAIPEETEATQDIIAPAVTEAVMTVSNEVAIDPQLQVEPPVLAQITATMAVLEYQEGYEYQLNEGRWLSKNTFKNLSPNTELRFRQRLANKPETVSEPIVAMTKDRVPCSATVINPQVMNFSESSITLQPHVGYEYRINEGPWKATSSFSNLEPDTEYTLQQRVAETDEEYASKPSKSLTFKTAHVGPSTYGNFTKVREYINTNGFIGNTGAPTIAYSVEVEETIVYYFLFSVHEYYAVCNAFSITESESFLDFDTTFIIPVAGSPMHPETNMIYCYEGELVDEARIIDENAHIESYTDFSLSATYCNGSYLPEDQMEQLLNNTVAMMMDFWDEILFEQFGFGMKGLGFLTYEGKGDLYCHPNARYHLGELVSANQCTESCAMPGKEADQYCTLCGYKAVSGTTLPNTGGHQYDNACDPDCNVCGEVRHTEHLYSFSCDTECDICGALRTDPLAAHKFDENKLCTVCGPKGGLLGDATGDGKVNMGDASAVYAHVRGTTLLTDSVLLAMADVSGDGNINMGDISMIIAHVRGTKPLW